MGKHRKGHGVPKHAKTASHVSGKRIAAVGGAIAAIPAGAVVFAGPASAATMNQWDTVARCESGGDWAINHSSDGMSVGGLQFQNASWRAALGYLNSHGYDTSSWTQQLYQGMPRSTVPGKDETILAGEALLHLQGPSAWVCDGLTGFGLGRSMFDGGANPWGLPGTSWPGSSPLTPPPVTPPPPRPVPPPPPVVPPVHPRHHHHAHHFYKVVRVRTAPAVPGDCDHVVVRGDTVSEVAQSHGVTVAAVEALNPGIVTPPRPPDYSLIFPGGHIHLPPQACG